ncbi:type II secretion system F family protein [Lapidilactobacillus bayanensis]|uniref:type II secretion system F family protein n=1 Tax=Lapidilactobacillus bayanensis TaxID=2485998 RepID=UPI000F774892|nr:type II secretion system F family protein [Lapidilactobacillus bayanensis]
MVSSQKKHFKTTAGASSKVKKLRTDQVIELLELSGQLLGNGYPVQDVITFADRLKIVSVAQGELMTQSLNNGASLAQTLATIIDQPNLIMQLEIADQHGDLATCCQDNAHFLREQRKQLKQLHSLMAYPLILLVIMSGLVVFIQLVLKPQLQSLLPTKSPSKSTIWPWVLLIVIIVLIVIYCLQISREKWRYLVLHLPILQRLFRAYYNFVLFTDLAHLLGSGLSLQEILNFVNSFNNRSLQTFIAHQVTAELEKGTTLDVIIQQEPLLPPELELLLAKGDTKTFKTLELKILARRNFTELERRLKTLIEQVQPLLFIVIALIIGALYLQILIPIYDIMKGI